VNTAESAAFCHDCGTLMGWLLEKEIQEDEIYQIWGEMLAVAI
jgi:hypothetical protein